MRFSEDALTSAPADLAVKRNSNAQWSIDAGADEVLFYQTFRMQEDHPAVIPPCIAANYDEDTQQSYIVLADLSATYAPPATRDQGQHC